MNTEWLPWLFLALALSQVCALPLGIMSGRMKSRNMLIVYITLMILIVMGFAAAGGIGWTMAGEVVTGYHPSK